MGWYGYTLESTLDDDFIVKEVFKEYKISDLEYLTVEDFVSSPKSDHHKQIYCIGETRNGEKVAMCAYAKFEGYEWTFKIMDETMGPALVAASDELISKLDSPLNIEAQNWRQACKSFFSSDVKAKLNKSRCNVFLSNSEKKFIADYIEKLKVGYMEKVSRSFLASFESLEESFPEGIRHGGEVLDTFEIMAKPECTLNDARFLIQNLKDRLLVKLDDQPINISEYKDCLHIVNELIEELDSTISKQKKISDKKTLRDEGLNPPNLDMNPLYDREYSDGFMEAMDEWIDERKVSKEEEILWQFDFEEEGEPLTLDIESYSEREAWSKFHSMTESDMHITNVRIQNLGLVKDQQKIEVPQKKRANKISNLKTNNTMSDKSKEVSGYIPAEPTLKKIGEGEDQFEVMNFTVVTTTDEGNDYSNIRASAKFFDSVKDLKPGDNVTIMGYPKSYDYKDKDGNDQTYNYLQLATDVEIKKDQKVNLSGNAGQDLKIMEFENGKKGTFTIGVNKEGEETKWYRVNVGKNFLEESHKVEKGDLVGVTGYLKERTYTPEGSTEKKRELVINVSEAVSLRYAKEQKAEQEQSMKVS